jgi:predicted nucleotidyltransferase
MDKHQMMLDAFVETIRKNYSDSIGLVIVYGSYVTGRMNPKSDVDVVFICKNDRGYEMSRQFIFEDIGYDFFGMSMERFHRIIDEFQPLVSIIAEGKMIFADSPEKERHFIQQQERILTLEQTTSPLEFSTEIASVLKELKCKAFEHQFADKLKKLHLQGQILYLTGHLLGLVNRRHFKYGTKKWVEEIANMPLKPKTIRYYLELLTRSKVDSQEIMKYVETLSAFWNDIRLHEPIKYDVHSLDGFYEEALSTWNKFDHAAEQGELMTAFLAATTLENELSQFRGQDAPLTLLFKDYDASLASLKRNGEASKQDMIKLLQLNQIEVKEFASLEAVLKAIRGDQ